MNIKYIVLSEKADEYQLTDELVITSAATLNNLTYYAKDKNFLLQKQELFAEGTSR